ncbi:MAG: M42 family metallopeptidase [Clostridia bacterium]
MSSNLEKNVQNLCLLPGLSGHEEPVSQYMKDNFLSCGLPVQGDILGNVYTKIKGENEKLTVLITGHMDQMGFVVKTITEDGFIKLERVGGVPEKTLPSLKVVIQTETNGLIPGLIGVKSHHLTSAEEKYKVDKYQDLYVDIGYTSCAEVLALGIDVGSPIVYEPFFGMLQNRRFTGTALDNRISCAILLELAERFSKQSANVNVVLAGTVQEEFTIRGASIVAHEVKPDICICLDITIEGQTPDLKGTSHVVMGNGPAISLYNFHGRGTLNGTMPHPSLVNLFKETAKKTGINLQRTAVVGGLSELSYMQVVGKGLAGVDIAIPCRYTHSQVETADFEDIEKTVNLVESAIRAITDDFKLIRI